MDILNYFQLLVILIMLLWTFACNSLCRHMFSFLLETAGSRIEDPMVILGEIEETAKLCSKVFVPFYNSTSNVRGFPFLHILANICSCPSFNITAILVGVKWYFIVVDLHFLNDLHFLKALSASFHILIFFGEMSMQGLCPFFEWVGYLSITEFFIYSRTKSFVRYMHWKHFLPIWSLDIHFLNNVFWRENIFNFDKI